MRSRGAAALAALGAAVLLSACGRAEPPAADAQAERAAATERARQGAYGTQMKSLDEAKALGADVNAKAGAAVDDIEKNAK